MADRMLRAALSYIGRGWSVFPCQVAGKRPAAELLPRGEDGKPTWKPFQTEPATEGQARAWWLRRPDANIAIVTGAVSGLVVLDLDAHAADANGLDTIRRLGLDLPATPTVRTPSGGLHMFFRHPGGQLRNFQARADLPGVDARGDGGYVVAVPSRTEAGDYQAVAETKGLPFAAPPGWLLDCFGRRATVPGAAPTAPDDEWADLWRGPWMPGQRHGAASRLIGHLREHGLGQAEAGVLLMMWNASACGPPKGEAEIVAHVADLYTRSDCAGGLPAAVPLPEARVAFAEQPEWLQKRLCDKPAGGAVSALRRGVVPGIVWAWILDLADGDVNGAARRMRWALNRATGGGRGRG